MPRGKLWIHSHLKTQMTRTHYSATRITLRPHLIFNRLLLLTLQTLPMPTHHCLHSARSPFHHSNHRCVRLLCLTFLQCSQRHLAPIVPVCFFLIQTRRNHHQVRRGPCTRDNHHPFHLLLRCLSPSDSIHSTQVSSQVNRIPLSAYCTLRSHQDTYLVDI